MLTVLTNIGTLEDNTQQSQQVMKNITETIPFNFEPLTADPLN